MTYVYAKDSALRAGRGFLNDVQNINSNCDITMWAGIYNFPMHRGVCFDWNYFHEDYKMQTYWSFGDPCSTRDLIPWKWKNIMCMNEKREPNRYFSYPLGNVISIDSTVVGSSNHQFALDPISMLYSGFVFHFWTALGLGKDNSIWWMFHIRNMRFWHIVNYARILNCVLDWNAKRDFCWLRHTI